MTGLFLTLKDALRPLEVLSYFTTVINVMTAMVYAWILVGFFLNKPSSTLQRFFKQTLMVYLMLTLIVYSFVLIPYILQNHILYQIFSLKDTLIHYVVPILVFLDYAIFDAKGKLSPVYVGVNYLVLAGYVFYLWAYIALGGRFRLNGEETIFPYFFLDLARLGLPMFVVVCVSIILTTFILGWILYKIDQLLGVDLISKNSKRK